MFQWQVTNENVREFLAEFIGTTTLTCLGYAGNTYINLHEYGGAELIEVSTIWGLALVAAIFVCGGVSGGHVNPAITIGMASVGKLKWSKVLHYMAAQYLGAFFGALLALVTYYEAISETAQTNNSTMGFFGVYSAQNITTGAAVLDQLFGTAFFLLIICAIKDERNMAIPKGLVPFAIGFANIDILHLSLGYNCGTPLNPARDFSPRLLSLLAGWGNDDALSAQKYSYFWTPFLGCHMGAIAGCWLYQWMIQNHWPVEKRDIPKIRVSPCCENATQAKRY